MCETSSRDAHRDAEPATLYQGDRLTIYYDTNTWSFTRLGSIVSLGEDDLPEVLGEGTVTVTLTAG